MQTFRIREMMPSEIGILRDFLYEAIHQVEGDTPLPGAIIDKPELAAYIQDFGKADDACRVVEMAAANIKTGQKIYLEKAWIESIRPCS